MHNPVIRRQRDLDHARAVQVALESQGGSVAATPLTPGTLPGDPWALRGIPAVGGTGTIGGHITGTRPDRLTFLER